MEDQPDSVKISNAMKQVPRHPIESLQPIANQVSLNGHSLSHFHWRGEGI
jgi:hypothetical protein